MFCEKCGKEISDDAIFCSGCGAPVAQKKKKSPLAAIIIIAASVLLVAGLAVAAVFYLDYRDKHTCDDCGKVVSKVYEDPDDEDAVLCKDCLKEREEEKEEMAAPAADAAVAAPAPAAVEEAPAAVAVPAARDGLIKVGIINNDPTESGYRMANDRDMKSVFNEENGFDATFAYSIKNDEQITAAQKFIQDGVDYLLLSPADSYGWDGVLHDAREAGIKVILFDRTLDASPDLYSTMIVSDMSKEGEQAVEWLKKQNLREYNIIHLQGIIGSMAQIGRSGALDEMVRTENNWNLVTQRTAEWNAENAYNIVSEEIRAGSNFNVIYAENDDMARGAVAALDDAGITHGIDGDVIIMSFDCSKWALQELLDMNWNYDGQCSPFQASEVYRAIMDMEAGREPEKVIILDEKGFDAETITADDVMNYGL